MCRYAHEVDSERGDIHGDFPETLNGVGMQQGTCAMDFVCNAAVRGDRTHFIVCQHQRNDQRTVRQGPGK